MKNILRKTQQKIYAIWRKAKQHISSFIVCKLKKDTSYVEKDEKNSKIVIFRKFKQNIKDVNMGISKDIRRYLLIGLWVSILFYHSYDYFILGK